MIDAGSVSFEGREEEDRQVEISAAGWEHWTGRRSGVHGLVWIGGVVFDIQLQQRSINRVAPVSPYPTSVDRSCQRIRVV